MLQLYGKPIFQIDGLDDDLAFEQVIDFSGGEDDYRRSTLINKNQCQKLVNIIIRDNYEAWTRPGADLFAPQISPNPVQTLFYFDTPANKYLLSICNGKLAACSGQNEPWQNPATPYNASSAIDVVEIEQGIDSVLVSDGVNALAVMDGNLNLTVCTTGAYDPPVGMNILCWHTGRMFGAGFAANRDTVAVSDLLAIGNGSWNLTTRSFRVGAGDGDPIIALHSMQGITLAVGKANSIWLVQTDPTAEPANFQASTLAQSVSFGIGVVGKRAMCSVGNDLFFFSQDGVRSVQRMQAAANQWQLSAPISQPVQQYIDQINPNYRQIIQACSYKEFVFFAVPLNASTVNNAVLVYNSRLQAWLGCWTGWFPTAFAKTRFNSNDQMVYADTAGNVYYWKDQLDSNNPTTYTDNGQNIACTIWTRSFQFSEAVNNKSAYACELRFTSGNSTCNLGAVMDLSQSIAWTEDFAVAGDILGIGHLGPFQLASAKPVKVNKSLRSLPSFNEMYLSIQTNSGFFKLRNITVAAFLDALNG
ncbi:MAG: hypothetical protein KGL39_53020 [Patescibacteria group bacterium]|nr:hypothetical protein [Patescibacteria group bacterium]